MIWDGRLLHEVCAGQSGSRGKSTSRSGRRVCLPTLHLKLDIEAQELSATLILNPLARTYGLFSRAVARRLT